jgi:hypothetical protein
MNIKCEQIYVETNLGKFKEPIFNLSKEIMDNISSIGYSGHDLKGVYWVSFINYLNSLNIGVFSSCQIKYDNGDFINIYVIAYAYEDDYDDPCKTCKEFKVYHDYDDSVELPESRKSLFK